MATMRQIAREAELSVATICRAMHEPEKLSPDTLERVLIAKKKLDLEASVGNNLVGLHVSRVQSASQPHHTLPVKIKPTAQVTQSESTVPKFVLQ